MMSARIVQIAVGIAGLSALILGLLFWVARVNLIGIHILFGLIVALTLLTMSILAISTRGMRIWGLIGIVYTLIVPAFGLSQAGILVGNLHWLIQAAHLLVGIGAVVLAGIMSARYRVLKSAAAVVAGESQVLAH